MWSMYGEVLHPGSADYSCLGQSSGRGCLEPLGTPVSPKQTPPTIPIETYLGVEHVFTTKADADRSASGLAKASTAGQWKPLRGI